MKKTAKNLNTIRKTFEIIIGTYGVLSNKNLTFLLEYYGIVGTGR